MVGLYVAYHPLSKQLYEFVLSDNSSIGGVAFSTVNSLFTYYTLSGDVPYVLFDEEGTPFWRDPTSGNSFILESSNIELIYGDLTKQVILESGYGRVVVQ